MNILDLLTQSLRNPCLFERLRHPICNANATLTQPMVFVSLRGAFLKSFEIELTQHLMLYLRVSSLLFTRRNLGWQN